MFVQHNTATHPATFCIECEEVVEEIVEETNRYASVQQEMMPSGVKGKLAKWVRTTVNEMYSFLVAVCLMGIVKKFSLREYWITDPILLTPIFTTLFSQDRFLLLLRCLHFVDSARGNVNDPHKIRNVLTGLTTSFRLSLYHTGTFVSMNPWWSGRVGWHFSIPTQRHRAGVKFFVLCDVLTGYVEDLIIYTGSRSRTLHIWVSRDDLTCTLLQKGPHPVLRQLVQQPDTVPAPLLPWNQRPVGPFRQIRRGCQPSLLKWKRAKWSFNKMAVSWPLSGMTNETFTCAPLFILQQYQPRQGLIMPPGGNWSQLVFSNTTRRWRLWTRQIWWTALSNAPGRLPSGKRKYSLTW